jgi:hypothetical protein
MTKVWLIRTSSHQIVGPVSREKIIELLDKGIVRQDDEICAGNGYWFHLSELDHIEKYLRKNESQPFNPVTEAEDIVTKNIGTTYRPAAELIAKPSVKEKYDTLENINSGSINLSENIIDKSQLKKTSIEKQKDQISNLYFDEQIVYPKAEDLQYPEETIEELLIKKEKSFIEDSDLTFVKVSSEADTEKVQTPANLVKLERTAANKKNTSTREGQSLDNTIKERFMDQKMLNENRRASSDRLLTIILLGLLSILLVLWILKENRVLIFSHKLNYIEASIAQTPQELSLKKKSLI